MRRAQITRETGETRIEIAIDLDGTGRADIASGIGFLDHMLTLLARHSLIDILVRAHGDLGVDDHHTTEDIGIVLGQALAQALGDKAGITRYADCLMPMDETLSRLALDISGRSMLVFDARFPSEKIGSFDSELVREFFQAFAANAGITLHAHLLHGANSHHIAESLFKGLARCLRLAVAADPRAGDRVPSTKGTLSV